MKESIKNLTFREAKEADLPDILALYAQPAMDNGKVLHLHQAKMIYNQIQSYPNYHIYVGIVDHKIVGTFALLIMHNLAHMGASSGIIEDVMVDPAYQRKGIGKKIMQFAQALCQEAGCYKLVLSSNIKRTNAHKFYESCGFKQHGMSFIIEM